jgi:uncharacterized delta-60 repeat protein
MRSNQKPHQANMDRQYLWIPCRKATDFCRSFLGILLFGTLAALFLTPVWAADGALDPSFNPGTGVNQSAIIRGILNYEDGTGRSLVYGYFTSMNGQPCNSIGRLSSTESLDPTFNASINGEVRQAIILDDGKIIVAGRFYVGVSGGTYYNVARLNSDGTLDTNFYQTLGSQGAANAIAVQSDGRILVGGWSLTILNDVSATYHLLRLNANGSPDGSYPKRSAPEGQVTGIQIINDVESKPNLGLVFGSLPNISGSHTGYVVYFLNTGTVDSYLGDETFNGLVYSYALDSQNRRVYVGLFTEAGGASRMNVARLNSDRSLDISFNPGAGSNGQVNSVIIQSDDKIVVAGNFDQFNNNPVGNIVRLNDNGSVDSSFAGSADDRIFGLSHPSDDHLRIVGAFRSVNGVTRNGAAILNDNGGLTDHYAGLTNGNTKNSYVYAVATQPDGKVLLGGDFTGVQGKYRQGLARLNPDGSLDTTFRTGVDGSIRTIALQPDGKILLGGSFGSCNGYGRTSLARVNPTASLDLTFNPIVTKLDGSVSDIYKIVPTGDQIMLAGHFRIINGENRTTAARLFSTGALDITFDAQVIITGGTPASGGIRSYALAPTGDGKYMVGGYVTYAGLARGWLTRLTTSGAMDTNFIPTTPSPNVVLTTGDVKDLALQPDGRIVIVGGFGQIIFSDFDRPERGGIARFTADGALDGTLTTNIGANNIVNCLALQPNGKFILGGYFTRYNLPNTSDPNNASRIVRVNPDGSFDGTFKSMPGANNALWAVTLLPGGKKAYIGGQFTTYDGVSRVGIARIFTGKSDIVPVRYLLLD